MRTVLITGASTGIGRDAARAFVTEGDRVVAVARSLDRLEALCEELGGRERVLPLAGDVTDPASMEALAERAVAEWGLPDVVIANAGIGLDARFEETSESSMREVFEVNVFGVVRTLKPFVAAMRARGSGRLLLVSSIVGKRGVPHYAIYSASKFALHGMAQALSSELWGSGVTVGVVCPASTRSEFHERKLRHGEAQVGTRLAKHSGESVARALVKMAGSRRRELVLTLEGKALKWLHALAPRLADRLLHRMLVQR